MKYWKYLLLILLLIPLEVKGYEKAVVDINTMSIYDLADALDKGYLTSEALVQLYLDRIDAYNEKFNAINQINDKAIEEAKALDKERKEGHVRSKLHGIPIIVKTNIDVKGLATTAGAKALKDNYPNEDALVVKKLKEAGAIILGSANMSEFAFKASDSYSSYGHVRNAFNTDYSPYGSSGGSAVALAVSFASATLGTDTNSSVRIPAAAAGVVGLRPTFGLIGRTGVIPYDLERDTIGILTKTVNDNALILGIIAGEDENDEATKNTKVKDYEANINLSKIKIGLITDYAYGDTKKTGVNKKTDDDIAKLVKEKVELLKNNGLEVVEIEELVTSYYQNIANSTLTGGSFCDGFNKYIKNTKGTIRSFADLNRAYGKVYGVSDYLSSCNNAWRNNINSINNKKNTFLEHIDEVMKSNDVDILIYPTVKNKNLKINEDGLNAPGSFLGSVIGYPSITVPMGYIGEFAYGLEFFSTKYNEDLLYEVARTFESINNLEIVNSKIAPSLYEIPGYINDLKDYYEKYYNKKSFKSIDEETRSYFLNYSKNEDDKNEEEANELINEYRKKESNSYSSKFLGFILIIIGIAGIIRIITLIINLKDNKKLKSMLKKF